MPTRAALTPRMWRGVSQVGCLTLSQARRPEALPTATAAVAAHCMHMRARVAELARRQPSRIGKLLRTGLRSDLTLTATR